MNDGVKYSAPWSISLKWMTVLSMMILAGISVAAVFCEPCAGPYWVLFWVAMPFVILLPVAVFSVQGFVLYKDLLVIQRAGWQTKINLERLVSIETDQTAMAKSVRIFGNGGMFCFPGIFWCRKLGKYHAFATDPLRSVVLKFPKRIVVVTPDCPEGFVQVLRDLQGL